MTEHFQNILAKRVSRRHFLKKSAIASGVALAGCAGLSSKSQDYIGLYNEQFDFSEISHGFGTTHEVAPGYTVDVLIKWGDPLFSDAPAFNVNKQTPETQERQFGFNNDYIGYLPLTVKPGQLARAVLCINHEYSLPKMMFPEVTGENAQPLDLSHVQIEQSSVGNSIVEVVNINNQWQTVVDSPFNRRITARTSKIGLSGPAAGHPRMQTHADPQGTEVIGTLMNCAGGMTPWGTYLTCEENFNNVFTGVLPVGHQETTNYTRYGVNGRTDGWGQLDARFDISSEPNEANRFGWVVEIDPLNPEALPKKRTALGRFKHEGAESVIAPDGRLVVYMGDDAKSEYLYKFVSRDQVNQTNKGANADLLDNGMLYVAKFFENGVVKWLPLTYGQGSLNANNGFYSQADVVINARSAADLLGATPLDRPEDVVPNPSTGKVYTLLTNNTEREAADVDGVNPRPHNEFGQIVELIEPNGDFAATESQWEMLILAGDPADRKVAASWHSDTSENGWFACPDNGVIDYKGRLWIGTDQGSVAYKTGTNDGIWAMETEGPLRGKGKMFFRGPDGAEVSGPMFSDDGKALFAAIQHPGVGSSTSNQDTLHNPVTRWPDFSAKQPPRSAIVVIQKDDGGQIG